MSSHIWKCSQCNKQEKIYLKDGIINTNCQCGYYSNMSIKEFIKIYKRDKSHNIIIDVHNNLINSSYYVSVKDLVSRY